MTIKFMMGQPHRGRLCFPYVRGDHYNGTSGQTWLPIHLIMSMMETQDCGKKHSKHRWQLYTTNTDHLHKHRILHSRAGC